MKRPFIVGTMLSGASAVGLAARQPTMGSGLAAQGGQTRSGGPRSGAEVTLTGCLQAAGGSGLRSGAAGSTGSAAAGRSCILTQRPG